MKEAFVFEVGLDAALDGFKVGEKISVCEDDAARLGGGARGEKDFRDVLAGEWLAGKRFMETCFTRNSLGSQNALLRRNVG